MGHGIVTQPHGISVIGSWLGAQPRHRSVRSGSACGKAGTSPFGQIPALRQAMHAGVQYMLTCGQRDRAVPAARTGQAQPGQAQQARQA